MPDYMALPTLQHFVLEESWVLGILARPGSLEVDIDLVFARDHPELLPPRRGEHFYSRLGAIRFSEVTSLNWTEQGTPAAVDASGQRDWGAIDTLTWSERSYELTGDFGVIRVEAALIDAVLTGPL